MKALVSALAVGSALLLAACGGGGGGTSPSATTAAPAAAPTDNQSNLQDPAVQQCLAEKGVSFPPNGREGPRTSIDDASRQAMQDCGVNFGRGQGGAFNDPAVQQCLADKGITLGQRGREGPRTSIDDATRQAIQDCRAQETTTTSAG
jgi:hypothetical protein